MSSQVLCAPSHQVQKLPQEEVWPQQRGNQTLFYPAIHVSRRSRPTLLMFLIYSSQNCSSHVLGFVSSPMLSPQSSSDAGVRADIKWHHCDQVFFFWKKYCDQVITIPLYQFRVLVEFTVETHLLSCNAFFSFLISLYLVCPVFEQIVEQLCNLVFFLFILWFPPNINFQLRSKKKFINKFTTWALESNILKGHAKASSVSVESSCWTS